MGEFLKLNVPPQDTMSINEKQDAGLWNCHNTCELHPSAEEPDLTADMLESQFEGGPMYYLG